MSQMLGIPPKIGQSPQNEPRFPIITKNRILHSASPRSGISLKGPEPFNLEDAQCEDRVWTAARNEIADLR